MEQMGLEPTTSALRMSALILRENFTDHSVADRVVGRYPNISSFKGCAAGKSSGFHIPSHTLQFRYTSRAGISGHKLATRKTHGRWTNI